MSGSRFVSVTVNINNTGLPQQGFGLPLIISHSANDHADFHERQRLYASPAEVTADGFAVDSPERLAANFLFGQEVRPPLIAIGRAESQVTMRYVIEAITIRSNAKYRIRAQGEGVTDTT